jgi:hypothetical protein
MDDPLIIGLGPLSKESIEAFLRIELPEVREDEEREPDMDFKTIGHFYHTILTKINEGNGDFDDNSCRFLFGGSPSSSLPSRSSLSSSPYRITLSFLSPSPLLSPLPLPASPWHDGTRAVLDHP